MDTNIFSLSVYFILLKIRNCYGLILLTLKKNEKNIKIDKIMPGTMDQLFCETPCIRPNKAIGYYHSD